MFTSGLIPTRIFRPALKMSTDSSVAAWPLLPGGRLALWVQLQHGAEAVRRLALLVEGVLQPQDLRFRGLQHADQLGVVLRRSAKLAVDVPELVPEDIDLALGD